MTLPVQNRTRVRTPPDPRTGLVQKIFDPLELIHALTTQIPDPGQPLVRDNVVHDTRYPCILLYGTAGNPRNLAEGNAPWNFGDSALDLVAPGASNVYPTADSTLLDAGGTRQLAGRVATSRRTPRFWRSRAGTRRPAARPS